MTLVICLGGLPGAGKSFLAEQVVSRLGKAARLETDIIRKKLWFGEDVEITAKLPPEAYGLEVSAKVYQSMFALARQAAEQGTIPVCVGIFPLLKSGAADLLAGMPQNALCYWLEVPVDVLEARVEGRVGAPDRVGGSDVDSRELVRRLAAGVECPPGFTVLPHDNMENNSEALAKILSDVTSVRHV